MDWRRPFSHGLSVARYLEEKGLLDHPLVGHEDYAASTVAGYARRRIHYARADRLGSYVIWNQRRLGRTTSADVFALARRLAGEQGTDAFVIWSRGALPPRFLERHGARLEAEFSGATVSSEDFRLYRVPPRARKRPS